MQPQELAQAIVEAGESRTEESDTWVQGRVSVQVQRPPAGRAPSCWKGLDFCFIQTLN